MKLFECLFKEFNCEQEYNYEKLVNGATIEKAEWIIMKYLKDWYPDDKPEKL